MIVQEILSHQLKSQQELDRILARCCELVLDGQESDPEHYGLVGACVVLPDGEEVYGVGHKDSEGLYIHAERTALNKCEKITPDCMVVTTLSPCNRPMDNRHGSSCAELLEYYGISLANVYCGYKDPSQDEDGVEETENPKLRALCKKIADTFLKDDVDEAFDQPYPTTWEKSEYGDVDASTKLSDGTYLNIMFNHEGDDEWQVEFHRNNSQAVTGEGDAQRVFATVLAAIQQFIQKQHPWRIIFSASKDVEPGQNSQSRAKLYNRLIQRYAASWGYDMYDEDHGDQVTYELTKLKPAVSENFADGKKPGRKGLAKRSGVDCKQSVTKLRSIAAHSTGERQRMAHWCANMKSGKKK